MNPMINRIKLNIHRSANNSYVDTEVKTHFAKKGNKTEYKIQMNRIIL